MVIVAHPDEVEFGAACTIDTWVKEGWEVYYVICTDASGGGPDDAMDVGHEARSVISNTRKSEQRAASALLGVKDVIFLDYQDGQLQPTLELRRDLLRVLRQYKPYPWLFPSPGKTGNPVYATGPYP